MAPGGILMAIIGWIMLGLLAGMLVRFLMLDEDLGGIVIMIVLGVAGALVGGFIGTLLGVGDISSFDVRSLAIAACSAMLLPFGYRCLKLKGQV
jgi:uncharacterized membrane protein YeaQ/YmgE (transglycosylase-associated protein family)